MRTLDRQEREASIVGNLIDENYETKNAMGYDRNRKILKFSTCKWSQI